MQLSEYLRAQDPTLRGYSRTSIYNMVLLYDTYSSQQFSEYQEMLKLNEIVQPLAGQFESTVIVQPAAAQLPTFPNLTTLTNHFEILNACRTTEERIFYVLYSYKEKLNKRELQRCLKKTTLTLR